MKPRRHSHDAASCKEFAGVTNAKESWQIGCMKNGERHRVCIRTKYILSKEVKSSHIILSR